MHFRHPSSMATGNHVRATAEAIGRDATVVETRALDNIRAKAENGAQQEKQSGDSEYFGRLNHPAFLS